MKISYLIILLILNFFWGAVYSAYKMIGPDLASGGIVTLRFGIGAVCLLAVWPWLRGAAPRGRDLALSCLMGVILVVVGQRLQVYGNQIGTAGNSSVLMAFEPLVTSVAAAIFLGEHIGPRRWFGFVLGLSGVALLHGVWRPEFRWTGLAASLIFVSSFICEGAYSVMGKPIIGRASLTKMLAISLAVGTAVNLAIDGRSTLAAARGLSPSAWAMLLTMGVVCTAVGYSLWFVVIKECPVNLAALTVFSQSVFGVAVASLWLGERLKVDHILGCVVIVAGLALGLSRQIRHSASTRDGLPEGSSELSK